MIDLEAITALVASFGRVRGLETKLVTGTGLETKVTGTDLETE